MGTDNRHRKVSGGKKAAGKRKRRRRQRFLNGIAVLAAAAVFCFSAFSLIQIGLEYKKGTDTYDKVEEMVLKAEDTSADETPGMPEVPAVDIGSLRLLYEEAEGWILFPDTVISYPIVQGKDNAYYLNHMIDGTKNSAGTLFVEVSNQKGFADRNTIIYGHNMKNGSMFGQLKKYGKKEYYKEHPFFYLYTEEGVWKYDIFSVRVVDEASASYTINFGSDAEYQKYIDQAHRTSMYDTGVTVNVSDTIVTLSTCTGKETNRLIVQAVRGEKIR